jgi:hypothetical protein
MEIVLQASRTRLSWALNKGDARTFRPRTAGVLRVTSGRAWATFNPASPPRQTRWCPAIDAGDFFLGAGTAMALRAGQDLVIESWPADADNATHLQWDATAPSLGARRWHDSVRQPARELGQGLAQVARASSGLAWGLCGYVGFLLSKPSKAPSCL